MAKNKYFKDYIKGGMGGSGTYQSTYTQYPMTIDPRQYTMSTPLGPGYYDYDTGQTFTQASEDVMSPQETTYNWDTGSTSVKQIQPENKTLQRSRDINFGEGEIYNSAGNYSKTEAAKSLGISKDELVKRAKANGFNSTQDYYESLAKQGMTTSGTGQVQSATDYRPDYSLPGLSSSISNDLSSNFIQDTFNGLNAEQMSPLRSVYADTSPTSFMTSMNMTPYGVQPLMSYGTPLMNTNASYVPTGEVAGANTSNMPSTLTTGSVPQSTSVQPVPEEGVSQSKGQPEQQVQQTPQVLGEQAPTQYTPTMSSEDILPTLGDSFSNDILSGLSGPLQDIAGLGSMEDYGKNIIDMINQGAVDSTNIQEQMRDQSVSELELAYEKILAEIPFMTKELQMEAQQALNEISDALDSAKYEGSKAKRSVENLYGDIVKS
jgi:hypothetical protein